MTKAKALRLYLAKFFDTEVQGNSTVSVLKNYFNKKYDFNPIGNSFSSILIEAIENGIGGGGGGGGPVHWDDIIGKPDSLVTDDNYVHTDNNFSDEDKEKLSNAIGELLNDILVSNTVGKYVNGNTILQGTEFETIFREMLSNTYYPTLTPPSANITYNAPTVVKVGTNVPAMAATVTLNCGGRLTI